MANLDHTLDFQLNFTTSRERQEFLIGLRNKHRDLLTGKDYRIGLANEDYESEIEWTNLLLTFIENGGPEAITAIAKVIKAGLMYLTVNEYRKLKLMIKDKNNTVEITAQDTEEEIAEKIENELLKDDEK